VGIHRIHERGLGLHGGELLNRVKSAVGGAKKNRVTGNCGRGKDRAGGYHFRDAGDHVVIEEIEEDGFVVRDAVLFGVGGGILFAALGVEGPGKIFGFEINGEQTAVVGAEVREISGEGGRREHRPVLEVEGKNGSAGFCIERMKEARVGCCEIHFAVIDGGGSDDSGSEDD